jgi:hypothetical protein
VQPGPERWQQPDPGIAPALPTALPMPQGWPATKAMITDRSPVPFFSNCRAACVLGKLSLKSLTLAFKGVRPLGPLLIVVQTYKCPSLPRRANATLSAGTQSPAS